MKSGQHIRPCYKQAEFVSRIEGAMGVTLGPVSCKIVDGDGMQSVMRRSGWSKNESAGVVGFQVKNKIYVLETAPWTVLHELVHRSGINGDRLNRYVAEGLTEAIARELKDGDDEHKPTYPAETAWVQKALLPLLGLSAVDLGTKLAKARSAPETLAKLIREKRPNVNLNTLRHQLRPQAPDQPSFNRKPGHVTRWNVPSVAPKIGWMLMLAGAGLVLSSTAISRPTL